MDAVVLLRSPSYIHIHHLCLLYLIVSGPVQLDSLGVTLTHEHLSCKFEKRDESKLWSVHEDTNYKFLTLENISIIKKSP